MGFDAAEWAHVIMPQTGIGVNHATKKVPVEPEAPGGCGVLEPWKKPPCPSDQVQRLV
jgi:hypothetical protein